MKKIVNSYSDFNNEDKIRAILVFSYNFSDIRQYEYHRISWVDNRINRWDAIGQWIVTYKEDKDGYKF